MVYERKTKSVCPECKKTIEATIIQEGDKIYMHKSCEEHGSFSDIIATDVETYIEAQKYRKFGFAHKNPQKQIKDGCPHDCGMCPNHKSATTCAMVDVTNRCNLKCPICYANADTAGYVMEPPFEDIIRIYKHFRSLTPVPPVVAMFAGGEPTLRDDLPEIAEELIKMGFKQIQVATNGIRLANDIKYFKRLADAGANVLYLQFDGIESETWIKTRGVDIFEKKKQVIENCRKIGFQGVCLVPTIAKGVNYPHEIGNILQFAADNVDVVSGVMFQPVALCGRVDQQKLFDLRVTTYDVLNEINKYTNDAMKPWRPFPAYQNLMRLIAWWGSLSGSEIEHVEFVPNPQCGFVTFMHIDEKKDGPNKIVGFNDIIDIDGVIKYCDEQMEKVDSLKDPKFFQNLALTGLGEKIGKLIDRGLHYLNKRRIQIEGLLAAIKLLKDPFSTSAIKIYKMLLNQSWDNTRDFLVYGRNVYVGVMHFQDEYNLDVERVSQCVVHFGYIDPADDKVKQVPFCTMNTLHRPKIEKALAAKYGGLKKEGQKEEAVAKVPQVN
ncbi:MAG: tetraether lipid synthase Tes [Candidatus Helarchaeota archaeon]